MNLNRIMMDEVTAAEEGLRVLAESVHKRLGLNDIRSTATSFRALPPSDPADGERPGVRAVRAKIINNDRIDALFEVLTTDRYFANADRIFAGLRDMLKGLNVFHDFRPFWDRLESDDGMTFGIELRFDAAAATPTLKANIYGDLDSIEAGAAAVKKAMGEKKSRNVDFNKIFGKAGQPVEPVKPEKGSGVLDAGTLLWAGPSVIDYIAGGLAVAVEVPHTADEGLALAAIAAEGEKRGIYFGIAGSLAGGVRGLVEICGGVEKNGVIIVRAAQLNIGVNPYEKNELTTAMNHLESIGRPVVFLGRPEEIRSAFCSQGMAGGPLKPVLARFPETGHAANVKYMLEGFEGLDRTERSSAEDAITAELDKLEPFESKSIVNHICRIYYNARAGSRAENECIEAVRDGIRRLSSTTASVSALGNSLKMRRPAHINKNFTGRIYSDEIFDFLNGRVFGQKNAVRELVTKLRSECLRPSHEPIRVMCQGPPGCGKSSAAEALAEYLGGIPYVSFDAAAISDPYALKSQLFGGATGLVNSYESGKLESAAKHHEGVVFEIMDADSCGSLVRSEIFSGIMNVLCGVISSSRGAFYSSASIIFIFTVNTSRSVSVFTGEGKIGFRGAETAVDKTAESTIYREIKTLASEAFLSRIGKIIYFKPIDEAAVRDITLSAVLRTLEEAALNFSIGYEELAVEDRAVGHIAGAIKDDVIKMGARIIHESAREAVSKCLGGRLRELENGRFKKLTVGLGGGGGLTIMQRA